MDGVLADEETLGNGVVAEADRNKAQYLELPHGQGAPQLAPFHFCLSRRRGLELAQRFPRARELQFCLKLREFVDSALNFRSRRVSPPETAKYARELYAGPCGFEWCASLLEEINRVLEM